MVEESNTASQDEARQLAAILAADVVGYSRLMEQNERDTLQRLRDLRQNLIQPTVAQHRGRIFKTNGDGFLVEFASVVDGVHCAVEIQRMMSARNLDLPEDRRLDLRIGVNLGDVFHEGDDVFGDGVNIAARLEGLADPGGIYVSRAVREQMREMLSFDFQDLGEHKLKNISRVIQVFRVRIDGEAEAAAPRPAGSRPVSGRSRRMAPLAAGLLVIALAAGLAWRFDLLRPSPHRPAPWSAEDRRVSFLVLPFDAPSGDAASADYAAALTDDAIARLGVERHAGLVLPRGAAQGLTGLSIEQVGRRLGVAYVVEGVVRRVGDTFTTRVTLTDVAGDKVIGSDQMSEPALAAHDQSRRTVLTLDGNLVRMAMQAEVARIQAMPEKDRDARDYLTLAWTLRGRHTREAADQEVALAERAVALAPDDPHTILAYGIALAYRAGNHHYPGAGDDEKKSEGLLQRVLAVDPQNIEAQLGQMLNYMTQGRCDDVLAVGDQILALDPAFVSALLNKSICLAILGREGEAAATLERIPGYAENARNPSMLGNLAAIEALSGDYAASEAKLRAALVALPAEASDYRRIMQLGLIADEVLQGKMSDARRELADYVAANPSQATITSIAPLVENSAAGQKLADLVLDGVRKAGMPE